MLAEDDLRRLADDIKANGLLYPIITDPDGRIIDGRNRLAACQIAGVRPRFEEYGGDPIPRILSVNNERRHMTTGQRAMATALTLAESGNRRNGRWKRGSIPDAITEIGNSTWANVMKQAGVVLDHAHELAAQVVSGELALSAAYQQAEAERQRKERIEAVGGDLRALLDAGVIDLVEAERRLDVELRLERVDADLRDRVRNGDMPIEEAEDVTKGRAQRIAVWATKIHDGLETLHRMAGYPVPDLPLGDDDRTMLQVCLKALAESGYGNE